MQPKIVSIFHHVLKVVVIAVAHGKFWTSVGTSVGTTTTLQATARQHPYDRFDLPN